MQILYYPVLEMVHELWTMPEEYFLSLCMELGAKKAHSSNENMESINPTDTEGISTFN